MPSFQDSNSISDTDVVRQVYDAINANDIRAAIDLFDLEGERVEPEGFPLSGTYRGYKELLAHFSQGRSTWAEGSCMPERILAVDDKVIAYLRVHVRLKDKKDWIDARIADGFVFREGKIILMRTFLTNQDALDWAGIKRDCT